MCVLQQHCSVVKELLDWPACSPDLFTHLHSALPFKKIVVVSHGCFWESRHLTSVPGKMYLMYLLGSKLCLTCVKGADQVLYLRVAFCDEW